ncbi:MAG: winged helix DNA-binding domain-containing protein [Nocardioidaceae bacterium]|nr:winged helix DNA-binding domain-containing protein [Nocardioidaceae bacterium]
MTLSIERERWLGYRWRQHGLGGSLSQDALDDLLVLGLQASRQSNGEHALSQRVARIGSTGLARAITPEGPLVSLWSVRGAPHAHRASQLDLVRDALAPLSTDDGGSKFVNAVQEVADAMGKIVTSKTAKGDVSQEVADSVSATLVQYCERCQARHVPDGLFRAAGRQAQLVIGPEEERATMLYPRPQVQQEQVEHPREHLLRAYFRVNGPTSRTHYCDWQQVGTTGVGELWDELGDHLVRVQVDGKRFDVPESLVESVQRAEPAEGVALVPPNDPYLRQTDRALLVPDSTRRKKVFKALSGPGALLVDGEIAGTWRYRRSDSEVSIEAFGKLGSDHPSAAERAATAGCYLDRGR